MKRTVLVLLGLFWLSPLARAVEPIRWLSFLNDGLVRSAAMIESRAEERHERVLREVPLYWEPNVSAPAGVLQIGYLRQRGFVFAYAALGLSDAVEFQLDIFDPDWGYGAALHTVTDVSGRWVQLPPNPFPEPVWLNIDDLAGTGQQPEFRMPGKGEVFLLGERSIYITEVTESGLWLRDEQPADMWCDGELSAPPVQPADTEFRSWASLYDQNGHALLVEKYTRGC